jgi:hypothetical protein
MEQKRVGMEKNKQATGSPARHRQAFSRRDFLATTPSIASPEQPQEINSGSDKGTKWKKESSENWKSKNWDLGA